MAHTKTVLSVALVLVAMLSARSTAQTDCTNVIISMSPCLNFITGNSTKPSSGCCSQLGSVVKSKPACLCQVLNGGASSLGIQVNQTQALALPASCNVQTPPLSNCKTTSPSSGSPSGSPSSGIPSSSAKNGAPGTVPTTNSGSSDGTSVKLAAPLLLFLLFVASYTSTFTM